LTKLDLYAIINNRESVNLPTVPVTMESISLALFFSSLFHLFNTFNRAFLKKGPYLQIKLIVITDLRG